MAWMHSIVDGGRDIGPIIELRNTYSREVPYALVASGKKRRGGIDRKVYDYGQILIKVSRMGVRVSMNGPCNLTPEQWRTMNEWIESAQEELREMEIGAQEGR